MTHPERTALLLARGATLHWDVLSDDMSDNASPTTTVHDPALAADWLDDDPDVLAAARTVAYVEWALAWWPASTVAGVPQLDRRLLRAEAAVAAAGIDHVLDEDTVTGALWAARDAVPALAAVPGARAAGLAARLAELAEDNGIVLTEPAAPARADLALAAGGPPVGRDVVVLRGTSPVDWALVPQGVVDAAAHASWTVLRRDGSSVVEVSVPRAPGARRAGLAARFGPVEVALDLPAGDGPATGRATVPDAVVLLPAGERTLTVYAPDFAVPDRLPDPDAPARRAAIVALARTRVGSPGATLAEYVAGA